MRFAVACVVVAGSLQPALAADEFVGIWKMNAVKSSGTLPKEETVTIQLHQKRLSIEVSAVTSDDKRLTIRYSIPTSGGAGHIESGPYDQVFVVRVNKNTMDVTYRSAGKDLRSTRAVVSKGGNVMTSTGYVPGQGSDWTMVFDKQR
jgi:hypothetical protein